MAGVQLEHIAKRFGALEVISDVNLEVNEGEFVVLVGQDKSHARRIRISAKHCLPIGGGDVHSCTCQASAGPDARTAHHVCAAMCVGPIARGLFKLFPTATVQLWGLWRDVGHQKALRHEHLARFGVCGGFEVSPIKPAVRVVVVSG